MIRLFGERAKLTDSRSSDPILSYTAHSAPALDHHHLLLLLLRSHNLHTRSNLPYKILIQILPEFITGRSAPLPCTSMQTEFPIGIIQQDERRIRANPIAERLRWENTAPVLALRLPNRGKVQHRLNSVIFSVTRSVSSHIGQKVLVF